MDNINFLGHNEMRILSYTKDGQQHSKVINSSKMWSEVCALKDLGCKNINLL